MLQMPVLALLQLRFGKRLSSEELSRIVPSVPAGSAASHHQRPCTSSLCIGAEVFHTCGSAIAPVGALCRHWPWTCLFPHDLPHFVSLQTLLPVLSHLLKELCPLDHSQ